MKPKVEEWMIKAAMQFLQEAHPDCVEELVAELAQIIAEHAPEQGWISVDEKLPDVHERYKDGPRDSESVLGWNGHYVQMVKYAETYKKRNLRWEEWPVGRTARVTHWMPLPKAPEGEKCPK